MILVLIVAKCIVNENSAVYWVGGAEGINSSKVYCKLYLVLPSTVKVTWY